MLYDYYLLISRETTINYLKSYLYFIFDAAIYIYINEMTDDYCDIVILESCAFTFTSVSVVNPQNLNECTI